MIKAVLKVFLVSLILSTTVNAEEKAITMRTMLDAVNLVQLGLLTNTKLLVKEGVAELKDAKSKLEKIDHTRYLSFDEVQGYTYTKEKVTQIGIDADEVYTFFVNGKHAEALTAYKSLMLRCMECHSKLRDYEDEGNRFR